METETKYNVYSNESSPKITYKYVDGYWQKQYKIYDYLGSLRYTISQMNKVLNYKAYDPYGNELIDTMKQTRQGYIGKENDVENGLGDHGVRKYDPSIGRFNSGDALWEKFPGISPYVYCFNNPISNTDDDGLNPYRFGIFPANKWYQRIYNWYNGLSNYNTATDYVNSLPNGTKYQSSQDGNGNLSLTINSQTAMEFSASGSQPEPIMINPGIITTTGTGGELIKDLMNGITLNKAEQKAITTLEKRIAEHQNKLLEYIKDPDKFDNLGFLKNAPNKEVRDKIIQSRIKHLKMKYRLFKKIFRK